MEHINVPQTNESETINHCDIENQDTTDMGHTGVEGLDPLFSGGNAQDTFDYQHIGDENNHRIQHRYKDYKDHLIQSIESSISTGQFDDILVKAECLGKDIRMAVGKKIKGQDLGDNRYKLPHQNSQPILYH